MRKTILVLFVLTIPAKIFPQGYNPPYPRLSGFVWSVPNIEYYSKFDLLFISNNAAYIPQSLKTINPDIKVVVARDINGGAGMLLPDDWKTRTSTGGGPTFCNLYFAGDFYADLTDFCPRLTQYGNQRFNEYVDDQFKQVVDLNYFDGIGTDGLWSSYYGGSSCNSDLDFDRDGVNDYAQHGRAWLDNEIYNGVLKVLENLRAGLGPDKLIIINSGGPHTWGKTYTNGFVHEHFGGHYSFDGNKEVYDGWMKDGFQPAIPIVNSDPGGDIPDLDLVRPSRNQLFLMRYGLTFALITGAFYDYTDNSSEHYWIKWYDEYELDLGQPQGAAQKTPGGAWVRFFERGVAVVNGLDTKTVTVTASEIRNLIGHDGPYYHFRGGQDLALNGASAINNGEEVTDQNPLVFTMWQPYGINPVDGGLNPAISDGVILVYAPQIVVSDIVIDDWHSGTSPGSATPAENRAANMAGFLYPTSSEGGCGMGSDYYSLRCAIYSQQDPNSDPPDEPLLSPPFAYAPGGTNANAIYTPSIGVPGSYTIYEWHGKFADKPSATNVPYIVTHENGQDTIIVNQNLNTGQWNYLGYYSFTTGQLGKVTISAKNAAGTVMADAIKFVYQGGPAEDKTAPVLLNLYPARDSLLVIFSEPLDKISAENINNYKLEAVPALPQRIISVSLKAANQVMLSIDPLIKNQSYQLTVNGIADISGNEVTANASESFIYTEALIQNLWVASGKKYVTAELASGDLVYIDREYKVNTIPAVCLGATWIKTAMDDKAGQQNPFLTYQVTENMTVWVAVSTASSLPSFLTTQGWQKTSEVIIIDIAGTLYNYILYEKSFPSGTQVSLGSNEDTQNRHMYLVLNKPTALLGSKPGSLVHGNTEFDLKIYPNPFNPSTRIYLNFPDWITTGQINGENQEVSISIYDIHGKVIRHLYRGKLSQGRKEFIWDGRDDHNRLINSGVYGVECEFQGNIKTYKILLLK